MLDFVNAAAEELGMKINWQGLGVDEARMLLTDSSNLTLHSSRTILSVDPRYFRPTEVETLLGDASKARQKLGWTLKISFKDLVAEIVWEDLKATEGDELVKKHVLKAFDYNE